MEERLKDIENGASNTSQPYTDEHNGHA